MKLQLSADERREIERSVAAAVCLGPNARGFAWRGKALGGYGMKCLVKAPALEQVQVLALERCGLTDPDIQLLAACPHLGNLRELYLCNRDGDTKGTPNQIGDVGARALATSPHLKNLQTLDLWNTSVGDAGFAALIQSPHFQLQSLYTWNTQLTREGAQKIKALVWQLWEQTAPENRRASMLCAIHTDYDERVISWSDDDYA